MKIIIKARYFVANFGSEVKTVIWKINGVNAAAARVAGEYPWGKQ